MDLIERHDLSRWLTVQLLVAVGQSFVLAILVLWALQAFGRTVGIGDCWAVSLVAVTAIRLQRMALPGTGSRRRRRVEVAQSRDGWLLGPGQTVLGRPAQDPAAPLPETLDRRFRRLARHGDRLTYAVVETRHYDSGVRPILAEIAADRLRRHHGIDMGAEPQRAHDAIGDDLWQALMSDRPAPPTAADLDRWLTALERLGTERSTLTDRLQPS